MGSSADRDWSGMLGEPLADGHSLEKLERHEPRAARRVLCDVVESGSGSDAGATLTLFASLTKRSTIERMSD